MHKVNNSTTLSDSSANEDGDDVDDADISDKTSANDGLIELDGCSIRTYWQLPANLNRCPLNTCYVVFENNSALRQHYREQHAKNAILCAPCGWPVMAKNINEFRRHFRKLHPNIPPPYGQV